MYVPKCFQTNITKEELIEKMKNKEILEKAAEKYNSQFIGQNEFAIEDFKNGAKWQQEQMCNHNYILTTEQGHRVIKCSKCNHTQPI